MISMLSKSQSLTVCLSSLNTVQSVSTTFSYTCTPWCLEHVWQTHVGSYLYGDAHCAPQQMYLRPLLVVCQWWHWMKQARSESLGADEYWDLVKWSLVTLYSTGEGEPPLTPLAQCLALVQPHTPSPTLILVQCMKWELHQWALLDWVDTAVGVGRKLRLTIVSIMHLKCMQCHLTVCWCVCRSLPFPFVHVRVISMEFSFTVKCKPGGQGAWLILFFQDLAYNCNDVSTIWAFIA